MSLRELLPPTGIHIPAHGGDGSDLLQLHKDFPIPYVSGVDDVVHTAQGLQGLRAEESMGI